MNTTIALDTLRQHREQLRAVHGLVEHKTLDEPDAYAATGIPRAPPGERATVGSFERAHPRHAVARLATGHARGPAGRQEYRERTVSVHGGGGGGDGRS